MLAIEGRSAELAVGQQRVFRHHSHALPAHTFIESFGITSSHGIEHEHELAFLSRSVFSRDHQTLRNSTASSLSVHQHLRDICAVRLVLRLFGNDLHRADNLTVYIFCDKQRTLIASYTTGHLAPEVHRFITRDR